jgi:FkbM family methyltransferase
VTGRLLRTAGRRFARAVVGPLPVSAADAVRRVLVSFPGPPLRSPWRRAVLRALAAGGIPEAVRTFALVDDPGLRFVAADSQVLGQVYWWGSRGWEPELLPWWRAFCAESTSVLELGANVGWFSVQGGRAAPAARYVAVEPHPFSASLCRAHLALNSVTSVEVIEAAAVPDVAPSVALHVPADQQATPTVAFLPGDTELPAAMARDVTAVLEVPAVDVRSLLDGVDLIKLDVEGQEHVLLAAMREHLRARRPTLLVEVLPGTAQLRAVLADLCTRDGYRCYAASARGLVELPPARLATVRLLDEFGCQDVVLRASDRPLTGTKSAV